MTAGAGADPAGAQPWSWHAVRVSGLFLAVLLPVHFAVTFVRTDIARTTAVVMTDRWTTLWRGVEWIVIVLALLHGASGIATLARSRMRASAVRTAVLAASGVVATAAAVVATYVLATYEIL